MALLLMPAMLPADECFCVTDADDNTWFDCVDFRPPLATQSKSLCRSAAIDARVVVPEGEGLQRIAAGTAPCTPCRLSDGVEGEAIRGDGEDEQGQQAPAGDDPGDDQ